MEALTQWLMNPGAAHVAHTPAEVLNRPEWHQRAICRGQGVRQWIGDSRMSSYAAQKALCDMCPVRRNCLEYALAHPALVGFWGGTTEHERRKRRAAASRRRSA
jgi:WhiB family redox-sensing transcriptional regulator